MRASRLILVLAIARASFACSDDPAPGGAAAGPGTPDGGAAACEDGERSGPEGCEPILPDGECAVGTRAEIGSATCVPVGPQACPSGFEKHESGWGCRPMMPA